MIKFFISGHTVFYLNDQSGARTGNPIRLPGAPGFEAALGRQKKVPCDKWALAYDGIATIEKGNRLGLAVEVEYSSWPLKNFVTV